MKTSSCSPFPWHQPRPLLRRGSILLLIPAWLAAAWPWLPLCSKAAEPAAPPERYSSLDSMTGHFQVLAPDTPSAYSAMKWAEGVLERYQARLRGLTHPRGGGRLQIIVANEPAATNGLLHVHQAVHEGHLLQRLAIVNMPRIQSDNAQSALCHLFLTRDIWSLHDGPPAADATVPNVPYWLSEGLAFNLQAEQRARNRELVLDEWQKGALPSIWRRIRFDEVREEAILPDGRSRHPELYRALCAMFVRWLSDVQIEKAMLKNVLLRLAEGEPVTREWLIDRISGGASFTDADAAWDEWMLSRKRVIHRPGEITETGLDLLTAELLLYSGDSGIPLRNGEYQRVTLQEVIDSRREKWIGRFAVAKCNALRLLAVGRGREYREVIGAYCNFFEELSDGASKERLQRLLNKAERARALLEERVARLEATGSFENGGE